MWHDESLPGSLPPEGADVRLVDAISRPWWEHEAEAGSRGRVVYMYFSADAIAAYGVRLDDPPPGAEATDDCIWWCNKSAFLKAIEPATLRDSAADLDR